MTTLCLYICPPPPLSATSFCSMDSYTPTDSASFAAVFPNLSEFRSANRNVLPNTECGSALSTSETVPAETGKLV